MNMKQGQLVRRIRWCWCQDNLYSSTDRNNCTDGSKGLKILRQLIEKYVARSIKRTEKSRKSKGQIK